MLAKRDEATEFGIVPGAYVEDYIRGAPIEILATIRKAYIEFWSGNVINPDSYFLRFPNEPQNRIIALPASLESEGVCGIKWISSFPGNHDSGLPRASAALILNSRHTGIPFACMDGALISSARTAASAVLGANVLHPLPGYAQCLGIVGAGPIARSIVAFLVGAGWSIDRIMVHDLIPERAQSFCNDAHLGPPPTRREVVGLEEVVRQSDLIVFATTSGQPYLSEKSWFSHNPTVLHVSLRDLSVGIIESSQNIVDDIDHCCKANTSIHLTETAVGSRDFIDASIGQIIREGAYFKIDVNRPRIFSPFGMGMLDLYLAIEIHRAATDAGALIRVPEFYSRHCSS